MKNLLITFLLFLSGFAVNAQDYFRGLIGYSYLTITANGNEKKVNKILFIIYNETYCELSVGGIVNTFSIDSYSKELIKGNLQESFISEETNTEPRGWYSITILHDKPGKSQITINMPLMPGGAAYFVADAQVYSENGKVTGHAHITNWKNLEIQSKRNDSILVAKKLTDKQDAINRRIDDSLRQINNAKETARSEDSILNIGNNYNNAPVKRISKIIDSALNMKIPDKYIYGNIKAFIDKDGNITSCLKGKIADNIGMVIPQINELLNELKLKVDPYNKNGKYYPSYCEMFIEIDPQTYKYYKNKKQ